MREVARTLTIVVAIAAVGAAGTLAAGAAMGMAGDELEHLGRALAIPAIATVAVAIAGGRLLARASVRQRSVAIALIASAVALVNVAILTLDMAVSDHDATLVIVVLLYACAAGVAAAIAVSRSSTRAIDRLGATARRLGDGDLSARAGRLDAGPEFDTLAMTLDTMAGDLAAARDREAEAEQTRRDLITTVSHDLRTPLSSLRAMIEAIDDGVVDDPATVRRYVGAMRTSTDQLVNLVDDLFELTQLDAGAIATETRRVRLGELAHTAIAAVRPDADAKGLVLAADIDAAADTPCSPRLARVLQNLLVNAVRHTPADGTVRLAAERRGARLHLDVTDTGEGIAPGDLPHVFEPFYRADPARSGPGAGLGLALAERIVEALGGTIAAESQPGAGARFAVDVPVS
jgi:signal transduction histidine kinase